MPCNKIEDRSFQNYLLLFIQDDRCHKERGLFFKTTKHLGGKLELHDRLRSTSTPQIGVHCHRYLKSGSNLRYSQIGVFSKLSDLWPIYCYQIDVLFSVKIGMFCCLVCWSSLYTRSIKVELQ